MHCFIRRQKLLPIKNDTLTRNRSSCVTVLVDLVGGVSVLQHGLHCTDDVRIAETEEAHKDDVTVDCNSAANLCCDTSAQSCVSFARAQLCLA